MLNVRLAESKNINYTEGYRSISFWNTVYPFLLALIFYLLFLLNNALTVTNVLLLIGVLFISNRLIAGMATKLNDNRILNLKIVFVLKILLAMFMLKMGWEHSLVEGASDYGYDPQRYFNEAWTFAESGFNFDYLPEINYTGIIFFYAIVFKIFGHNALSPLLINSFLTLYSALLLTKLGYMLRNKITQMSWTIGLYMIIPEVVWFDILTARETLIMSLIVISVVLVSGYLLDDTKKYFTNRQLIGFIPAILLIGLVRTSMMLPVVAIIILTNLVIKTKKKRPFIAFAFVVISISLIVLAPKISSSLGSQTSTYLSRVDVMFNNTGESQTYSWSNDSIGLRFIPSNFTEVVLFAPIRFIFYLVTPLPSFPFTMSGLASGLWTSWQEICTTISAGIYILLMPFVFSSMKDMKNNRNCMILIISFVVLMLAVASGNAIIQDRYRVMVVPFLWACVWLGYTGKVRIRYFYYWYSSLVLLAVLYYFYKGMI